MRRRNLWRQRIVPIPLGIARSNVSNSLRELQSWNLVSRIAPAKGSVFAHSKKLLNPGGTLFGASLPDNRPIFIFDAHCALCSSWVELVLRFDRAHRYRLLPAQSALGRALYVHYGLDPEDYETNILIIDGKALFKSEGSIRLAMGLGFPWSMAGSRRILPRRFADALYEWLARNRFRPFGRRQHCYLPRAMDRDRFFA
jgi:predicted DCC family thiol-disulfide oxidoreductase YuxK